MKIIVKFYRVNLHIFFMAFLANMALIPMDANACGRKNLKSPQALEPGVLSLVAGSIEGPGYADGVGLQAQFGLAIREDMGISPKSIVSDADDNLYLTDISNHTIRKIDRNGVVTTLAGRPGETGSADGKGENARFCFPSGIAVDAEGFLYVTDSGNFTIRKISPQGEVSTIAGRAGEFGMLDGPAADAKFRSLSAITVTPNGELFVSDTYNFCIRKIVGEMVSTFAGKCGEAGYVPGRGAQARFNAPKGIRYNPIDRFLYVLDEGGPPIRQITSYGLVPTAPKIEAEKNIERAKLVRPIAIAFDSENNFYVTEGRFIKKIDSTRRVTIFSGQSNAGHQDGVGTSASFNVPGNLTFDRTGTMYVADDEVVRKITTQAEVTTIAGQTLPIGALDGHAAAARFDDPYYLTVDKKGNLLVSDAGNHQIRKIDSKAVVTTIAGISGDAGSGYQDGAGSSAKFAALRGIAVDSKNQIYIADMQNALIRKIDVNGRVNTLAGTLRVSENKDGIGLNAQFHLPTSVVVDRKDNLYIRSDGKIRKVTIRGEVTTLAGGTKMPGREDCDGIGGGACFIALSDVAIAKDGTLFVTDDKLIRKVSKTGVVTTLGDYGESMRYENNHGYDSGTSGDGDFEVELENGSITVIHNPISLVVDQDGTIYFALNQTIRKLTSDGRLSTVAGVTGLKGTKFGYLGGLNNPRGLVMLAPKTLGLISGNAILKLTLP